jgi:crotonobetaine/carnitine-CoA ligase
VPDLLTRRVAHGGETTLLLCEGKQFSAEQVEAEVNRIGQGLIELGVSSGERVGLMASNKPETVFCWLAILRIGATCVPVNTGLRGLQLSYVLNHSAVQLLMIEKACLEQIKDVEENLEALKTLVFLDEKGSQEVLPGKSIHFLTDICGEYELDPCAPVKPSQLASILYTGGTTGPSKGVMSSHCQYYWWAVLMARCLELKPSDIWYTCLPFFHINAQGTFLAGLISGGAIVLDKKFSASQYWERVRKSNATVTSMLGTMAHILHEKKLPQDDDKVHAVRKFFCPGIQGHLQRSFERRFGASVVNAYGMTELNCVTSTSLSSKTPPGSMGKTLDEFEVKILGGSGQPVSVGRSGEMVVRPRYPLSVMSGYFRMPEETKAAWKEGWFHTGDRAYRDSEGNLFFVDRTKDCIRRRGENVSSFEVEQVVNDYSPILECAAYAVPSELGEDDVMVSVVARPGMVIDTLQLINWCRPRLAAFAMPRYVAVVESLPKTPLGRVRKFKLRERGVTKFCWDRESVSKKEPKD